MREGEPGGSPSLFLDIFARGKKLSFFYQITVNEKHGNLGIERGK